MAPFLFMPPGYSRMFTLYPQSYPLVGVRPETKILPWPLSTRDFKCRPQLAQMRLPPHSLEAEQAVLGGLLLDNSAWDRIGDVVAESDFYRQDHRQILRAIVRQIAENHPADAVTVSESLQSLGQLESVGGLAYIVALASNTPSAANIRRYAEIVRERSVMRRLAEVATGIADTAYAPAGRSASQLLDEAEAKVSRWRMGAASGGLHRIKPC